MDNQQVTLSLIEYGWLIGIIDGEGSFVLGKHARGYSPGVKIVNTNSDILERLETGFRDRGISYISYDSSRAENQRPAKRIEINGFDRLVKFFTVFPPEVFSKFCPAKTVYDFVQLRIEREHGPYGPEEHQMYWLVRQYNSGPVR